ncbi:MAG TPA: dynamin family protein [Candidatus Alectryocaccobium stercorigallinarum]|nr:dynamin family protein [Candidatus Alectryocaccobium stercorigallinarum]
MDDNNSRTILDFDELRESLLQIAAALAQLRMDSGSARLLGSVILKKTETYEKALRRKISDPFRLVIAGDFKRGKSTLINALLGKNIVPTAVTPETVTINEISYGTEPSYEAVLENGRRMRLSPDELKRESLEKLTAGFPSPVQYIRIRENCSFLRDITLVDTPGSGDLMKAFDDKVAEYLSGADAIVYVISARFPLSLTEQAFLSSSVLPQSFTRIIMAVNMADSLESKEDIEKIAALASERVRDVFPDTRVFALSALDELCRRIEKPRPVPELSDYLADNFAAFENALMDDILLQKEVIHSSRCVHLTKTILDDICLHIRRLQDSLNSGIETLEKRERDLEDENSRLAQDIEKRKSELSGHIDKLELEAEAWMLEFLARLKTELLSVHGTAQTNELERHLQFYLSDMIKQAISSCISRHQTEIADRIQQSLKSIIPQLTSDAYASSESEINAALPDVLWTGADTVMFFASDFLKLNEELGLLYVVGQAIAGFFRQSSVKNRQKDYLEPVLSNFDAISSEIMQSLKKAYDKLKATAVDRMDEYFKSQIQSSLESIRQTKTILEQESIKKEDASAGLEEICARLEELKENLTEAYPV